MIQLIVKSIKSKRAMLSVGLLAAFSGLFVYAQLLNGQFLDIQNLNNGIQTCFTRVNQSYTAKMIGDKSGGYLNPSFMMTSEECFSEALNVAEDLFASSYSFSIKQLNKLIADVHWFHENMESSNSPFVDQGAQKNISSRFEKIEMMKDGLIEGAESLQQKIKHSQFALNVSMSLLGFLALFLFLWEVLDQKSRDDQNLIVERDAEIELLSEGLPQSSRVEQVLSKAFENNNLENCSALFQKYHSGVLEGQMQYFITKGYHEQVEQDDSSDELIRHEDAEFNLPKNNQVATVVETLELSPDEEEVLDKPEETMDNILSQIVEHMSSSVFHKGILFELTADDSIEFSSNRDILEQIFFHSLNHSISSCEEVSNKRINVSLHRLGGTAIFEIEDSGIGFDPMLIKNELGMASTESKLPLELMIVKEIVRENNAEMTIENILTDDGVVIGGRMRIIFRLQQSRDINRGLVQIRKTTKRELLREMGQQQV
jgi:hypothetical protein